MLRVGVHGATGRVGRMVCAAVDDAPDLTLAWACGRDLPAELGCDVIVDFSVPEGLRRLLAVSPAPIVSGTTGLTVDGPIAVPLLHAANFSVGVAVLARLVREAASALPDFEIEIVEIHHSQKRDAPSGTALRLAQGLGEVHRGHDGLRQPGVGIHAVRAGDEIGTHTVYLAGPGERLELGHVATRREVFALGALRAARWLVGRPAGLYRIEDMLGA